MKTSTDLKIFIVRYGSYYVSRAKIPCMHAGIAYDAGVSLSTEILRAQRFTMPEANRIAASGALEPELCTVEYAPLLEGVGV